MGTGYLVDTNIAIGYLENQLPEHGMEMMDNIINDTPNISVITKIELLRFQTSIESYKILKDFVDESNVLMLNEEIVDQTIFICLVKSNYPML